MPATRTLLPSARDRIYPLPKPEESWKPVLYFTTEQHPLISPTSPPSSPALLIVPIRGHFPSFPSPLLLFRYLSILKQSFHQLCFPYGDFLPLLRARLCRLKEGRRGMKGWRVKRLYFHINDFMTASFHSLPHPPSRRREVGGLFFQPRRKSIFYRA